MSTTTSSTTTTTTTTFPTGFQYGFFYDQSRCFACHACALACRDWNNISPGPTKWVRVLTEEVGTFPSVNLFPAFVPCYHCENPPCIAAANGAMYKEGNYGAVLIDPQQATNENLKAAWEACPYGVISFDSDSPDSSASKCTMCIDRLTQNLLPACVMACPARALDFGPLDVLQTKYGTTNRAMQDFPDPSTTGPAVIVKQRETKVALVTYDPQEALQLMTSRAPLPQVFNSPSDVANITPGLMVFNVFNLKPGNVEDFIDTSKSDE